MKIIINEPQQTDGKEVVVVNLEGRLDTVASQECAGEWEKIMAQADKNILLNMSSLEYVASSGLRLLLSLRRETQNKGGELQLKDVNAEVMQILKMTGCQALFSFA